MMVTCHAKKKCVSWGAKHFSWGSLAVGTFFWLPIQINLAPESNVFSWVCFSTGSKVFGKIYKNLAHQWETRYGRTKRNLEDNFVRKRNPLNTFARFCIAPSSGGCTRREVCRSCGEAVVYDTEKRQKPGRPARQLTVVSSKRARSTFLSLKFVRSCMYNSYFYNSRK